MAANAHECIAVIDAGGTCPITRVRAAMFAPLYALPDELIRRRKPMLDKDRLRDALARVVHPDDLDKAIRRLTRLGTMKGSGEPVVLREFPAGGCAGRSIFEMVWDELDAVVERMMNGGEAETDKGMALGLASALAIIKNPYRPDIEAVREEAMARYEAEHADE
jgi:hypothetical protein